jgi:diacylglycerol O-acyltransferase / wax synthase
MVSPNYERLTALDNSFLLLERPNQYTHVASTLVFDAGPLRLPDGGIDFAAIREAHARVLHRIPRYRQVLKYIPLESHPVWIDDPAFDLGYHLRHTALPKPGTDEQLKRLSARIMQQHLDRSRPLWESWVVEGLEGDRFAIISKVHHCMIDGVAGVDLIQILLSTQPDAELPETPDYIPRRTPSSLELLRDEALRRLSLPIRAVADARQFFREAEDARREVTTRLRAVAETLGASLWSAAETPINRPIGPHRRYDWAQTSIAEIREVRKVLGGSVNDIVLTIVTGAFRRFLTHRRVPLADLDFRVMAPVSVRAQNERHALGNRVSAWVLSLPLAEPDPTQQLALLQARTAELKESKQALGAELLTQVAEWTPSTLLSLGARNATRLLPINTVVTNVPGPQVPMYLRGALLLEAYPHVPLVDNMGLGIALLSYNGVLHWGVNADYDLVPDIDFFMEALRESFCDLRTAASLPAETARVRRPPAPANGRVPDVVEGGPH